MVSTADMSLCRSCKVSARLIDGIFFQWEEQGDLYEGGKESLGGEAVVGSLLSASFVIYACRQALCTVHTQYPDWLILNKAPLTDFTGTKSRHLNFG